MIPWETKWQQGDTSVTIMGPGAGGWLAIAVDCNQWPQFNPWMQQFIWVSTWVQTHQHLPVSPSCGTACTVIWNYMHMYIRSCFLRYNLRSFASVCKVLFPPLDKTKRRPNVWWHGNPQITGFGGIGNTNKNHSGTRLFCKETGRWGDGEGTEIYRYKINNHCIKLSPLWKNIYKVL